MPWLYRQRGHGELAFATTGGHENSIDRPSSWKIVRVGFGAGNVRAARWPGHCVHFTSIGGFMVDIQQWP